MLGWKRDVVLLVLLQIAIGIPYLNSIPRIYVDEVWDSSLGYSLANTGTLRHPFVDGLGGMDIHYLPPRMILPLVCAAIFKVVDYSIATSRISSVLFGALAVVSLYAVMRRWFTEKQAFFAGLAMIIHPWFFEISRRARPEIYYVAISLLFLWMLIVFFDSGSRKTAFFIGILAGLSALSHPNGLILVFIIGFVIIIWQPDVLLIRLVFWAAIGFTITSLPYIIYVVWATQNPQVVFTEQMQIGMLHRSLTREFLRWKGFLKWPLGAGFALIMVLSWCASWHRSKSADKVLAAIVLSFILILPFGTVSRACRYLAATIPFFCALGIRFAQRIIVGEILPQKPWHKFRLLVVSTIIVIYLSTSLAAIGLMFYRLHDACLDKSLNRIASIVGSENCVCGDPIFWVGHNKYRYGPWLMLTDATPMSYAVEWARKYHFDYAIRTAWSINDFNGIAKPPQSMPAFRHGHMFDYFCAVFGTKVDEFRDPHYGPIELYKLDWNNFNWDEYCKIRNQK